MSGDADVLVDNALASLLTRVVAGYGAWPKKLVGARVYVVVDAGDGAGVQEIARTLRFDADKPRLFAGIEAPAKETEPHVALRLTIPQLYGLLTSVDVAQTIVAEGNEPAILAAIARVLT